MDDEEPTTFEIVTEDDWQFDRQRFLALNRLYGPFTLDGASDPDGANAHVAEDYCSTQDPFQQRDLRGHNVYACLPE